MSGGVIVASLGVVGAILAFMFFKLGEREDGKHYALQVIILAFILGVVVLLGKTSVDYQDNCSWLVSNSTSVGFTTNYHYSYECSDNTNNTATSFYKITLWVTRLIALYLLLTFVFELFSFYDFKKRGGEN
jgi:ABC-type thiamin/hydroxymethylpyrimidine transport system permease subunit